MSEACIWRGITFIRSQRALCFFAGVDANERIEDFNGGFQGPRATLSFPNHAGSNHLARSVAKNGVSHQLMPR
jgi:hypothetical protein